MRLLRRLWNAYDSGKRKARLEESVSLWVETGSMADMNAFNEEWTRREKNVEAVKRPSGFLEGMAFDLGYRMNYEHVSELDSEG